MPKLQRKFQKNPQKRPKTIKPKKELGQNFLTDTLFTKKMVSALELKQTNTIIEIGPGLGALTKEILIKLTNGKLYAIEFDPRLALKLKQAHAGNPNFEIIHANILDWLPNFSSREEFKIIGSLPFYITSPILHAVVHLQNHPETCVFMVQKEVAQKIIQSAPNASYLSTFLQTFFKIDYIDTVPNTSFEPIPQVDGAIIKMAKLSKPQIPQIKKYEGFLHKGFSNPRKMLNKVFTTAELQKVNISPTVRPQNLTVTDWITAFNALSN